MRRPQQKTEAAISLYSLILALAGIDIIVFQSDRGTAIAIGVILLVCTGLLTYLVVKNKINIIT